VFDRSLKENSLVFKTNLPVELVDSQQEKHVENFYGIGNLK